MRRISAIVLACVLSIMVGRLSPAFGSDAVALISSIVGKVELQRANEQGWGTARMGDQLFEGDVLQTHDNSKASLIFSNGSIITVYPKSRVALSLREMGKGSESMLVTSLAKGVMEGIGGIFSTEKKRETLTAIPGIRKKIEEEEIGVRVLYPRNSTILNPRPDFRWRTSGKTGSFMVSLTLKGMRGRLWTLNTKEMGIPYPKDQKPLERGQTYFVRVESMDDSSVSDEVYFRILDDRSAEEVIRITKQMEELQKSNPNDCTPEFILATSYRNRGLYHMALERLDTLEKKNPMERFILEEKGEIFAKMGFWKKWEEVNRKLNPQ
jgi:hypothetical protein